MREEFSVKEILRHRWCVYPRFILDLAPTDQVTDSKIDSYFLPGNSRGRHGAVKLGGWNIHCQNMFRLKGEGESNKSGNCPKCPNKAKAISADLLVFIKLGS